MKNIFYSSLFLISSLSYAQENNSQIKMSFFNGAIIGGYVDHGAFLNFTGPNVSLMVNKSKIMIGMLPSLRIKNDKSPGTKNSTLTPTLGIGVGVIYHKIALQIPFYYNTKTTLENGKWKIGIGLGYDFK